MYMSSQSELAPEEDQGILFNIVKTPQMANLDYLEQATGELNNIFETVPEKEHVFIINGMGSNVHQAIAVSFSSRGRSASAVKKRSCRACSQR